MKGQRSFETVSVRLPAHMTSHLQRSNCVNLIHRYITKKSNVCFLLFIQSSHANRQYCACCDRFRLQATLRWRRRHRPNTAKCIAILWFGSWGNLRPRTPVSRHQISRPTCCLLYHPEDTRTRGNIRTFIPDYTRHSLKFVSLILYSAPWHSRISFSTSRNEQQT